MHQRALEHRDDGLQPTLRALPGRPRRHAGLRANRRHDADFVAHAVKHHHDRRADHHRLGHADRIGLGGRQTLHVAHHVIAEVAENAGRHRRQAGGKVDFGLRQQRAQRLERLAGAGGEGVPIGQRAAIDLRLPARRAPHHVRVEPDHRIASALGASFHRFEQEHRARPVRGELQIGRHRRLEIGDQRGDANAGAPALVAGRICFEIAGADHFAFNCPRLPARRSR